jgi:hypothetical protein
MATLVTCGPIRSSRAPTNSSRCRPRPSAATRDAQPDHEEITDAAWFIPEGAQPLTMHLAMRQRVTNALAEPNRAYFD